MRKDLRLFKSKTGDFLHTVLSPFIIVGVSYLIYREGYFVAGMQIAAVILFLGILAFLLVPWNRIFDATPRDRIGPFVSLAIAAGSTAFLAPIIITFLFAFVCFAQALAVSIIDVPWSKLGLTAGLIAGSSVVAIFAFWYMQIAETMRAVNDNPGVRMERGADFVARLGAKLLISICIFASLIWLGVAKVPFTVGTVIGSLISLIYFRYVVLMGVLRGISIYHHPTSDELCRALSDLRPIWSDADGLLGYFLDIGRLAFHGSVKLIENPEWAMQIYGATIATSWLDERWSGSLSVGSVVVSGIAFGICSAP